MNDTYVNLNLDDIPDTVEPGWYSVRIMDAEIRDTRDGEGRYVAWTLEINETESEFNGERLWVNTPILMAPGKSKRALGIIKDFLRAAEFEADPDGFDIKDAIGSELVVKVRHREYEGKVQADVCAFRTL